MKFVIESVESKSSTATMSLSSVQAFFQSLQLDIPILETEANTATVALAAAAQASSPGVSPRRWRFASVMAAMCWWWHAAMHA